MVLEKDKEVELEPIEESNISEKIELMKKMLKNLERETAQLDETCQRTLRTVNLESEVLIDLATQDATVIRQTAQGEADTVRQAAQAEADAVRQAAQAEADTVRQTAQAEADAVRQKVQAEVEDVSQKVQAEVDAIRQSVQAEADAIRKKAQDEADDLKCRTEIELRVRKQKYEKQIIAPQTEVTPLSAEKVIRQREKQPDAGMTPPHVEEVVRQKEAQPDAGMASSHVEEPIRQKEAQQEMGIILSNIEDVEESIKQRETERPKQVSQKQNQENENKKPIAQKDKPISTPNKNRKKKPQRTKSKKIIENVFFSLFVVVVATIILFQTVLGIMVVKGESMQPTLRDGYLVLYNRLDKTPEAGNLIIFEKDNGVKCVKRVIGTEGSEIDIDNFTGEVLVDGQVAVENFDTNTHLQDGTISFPLVVQENSYFVLGDNREDSVDSRANGLVRQSSIKGNIMWVIKR